MIVYQLLRPAAQGALRSPALLRRIADACRGVRGVPSRATIGLRFVNPAEMRRLNRAFSGNDYVTDVLSFSAMEGKTFPHPERKKKEDELGDIAICPAYAAREARRRMINPQEELVRLIVHGTLHLAGMDHAKPKDHQRMYGLQEKIVERVILTRS